MLLLLMSQHHKTKGNNMEYEKDEQELIDNMFEFLENHKPSDLSRLVADVYEMLETHNKLVILR